MPAVPEDIRRVLMRLRVEILNYLDCDESDTNFCGRCHLPLPAGPFEAYEFCPWCDQSFSGGVARVDESRRIIEHRWETQDEIQCGECGGEYEQPHRYPFNYCPHCGAQFAKVDEVVIELPFIV